MDFYKLSAIEIAEGIVSGKWTAVEILSEHLQRIKKYDKYLNSVILLCEDMAISQAKNVDAKVARGEQVGRLAGVPFLVKDNFCVECVKTTCCSKMLEEWIPDYTATSVQLLLDEDAIFMGKTNMDEFAMGNSTETSIFGVTSNPWDTGKVAGGSSGGSAASVAAGFAPIALGSDTGGSVRQPAAFCGLQGFKPSYGQISRYGVIAYASSLDQVGVFSRSVADDALLMDILAQPDENDSTCDAYIRPSFINAPADNLKGRKIGVLTGYDEESVDTTLLDAMENTAAVCKELGAEIVEIDLPIAKKFSTACYYMVALGDASSKLACYDGMRYGYHHSGKNLNDMYTQTRNGGFGKEVRQRILIGTCILTRGFYDNYYVPAMKVRQLIADECNKQLAGLDAIIMPVTTSLAYDKGYVEEDKIKSYLGDAFSSIANLVGLPSISLYTGRSDKGLPINIQLLGSRFGDDKLIDVARVLEEHTVSPEIADASEWGKN